MSEESGIGECLQTRGVVCHDVGRPRNVVAAVAVAVSSLVQASEVAEASGSTIIGDGTA